MKVFSSVAALSAGCRSVLGPGRRRSPARRRAQPSHKTGSVHENAPRRCLRRAAKGYFCWAALLSAMIMFLSMRSVTSLSTSISSDVSFTSFTVP